MPARIGWIRSTYAHSASVVIGGMWGNRPVDGYWWNEETFWGGNGQWYWVRRDFMNC